MNELDQEFDQALLEQLNAKLVEAAKVMAEVNTLRQQIGLDSLIFTQWERESLYEKVSREVNESEEAEHPDFDEDQIIDMKMDTIAAKFDLIQTDALERELNQAGWSTSSSYC